MHLSIFVILSSFMYLQAEDVVVRNPYGEALVIEVAPDATFSETIEALQMQFANAQYTIDFSNIASIDLTSPPRNYCAPVTPNEKKDIGYIVNTLGMGSLSKIAKAKSSLKSAGDRIDQIHPLKFLQCVFTDEKMKASMSAMEGRTWVWSEFLNGITDSLEEEYLKDNMKMEYVYDFAAQIGINPDIIVPLIYEKRWNKLITTLIAVVPRNKDANRYDM